MKAINLTSLLMLCAVAAASCVRQSAAMFPQDGGTSAPHDGLLGSCDAGLEYRRTILPHMVSPQFKQRCAEQGRWWIEVIQRCEPVILTADDLEPILAEGAAETKEAME